jgi:hypothetical protein
MPYNLWEESYITYFPFIVQGVDITDSKKIATCENSHSWNGGEPHYEALYFTSQGEWFLLEWNSLISPYLSIIPGGMVGVEIHRLSADQAQAWLEDHQKYEELTMLFDGMDLDDEYL